MRNFFKTCLLIVAGTLPGAGQAADHLYPVTSIYSNLLWKDATLLFAERLGRMADVNAYANAVVFPAFDREYVIVFEEREEKHQLVCMWTEISLGGYHRLEMLKSGRLNLGSEKERAEEIEQLERKLPEDFMDVPAIIVEVEIDSGLAESVRRVWGEMLYDTRYPEPRRPFSETYADFEIGNDGDTYYFSFFHNHTPLSGWAWSPDDGRVRMMTKIVHAAKEACDTKDVGPTSAFSKAVRALSDEIASPD